MSTDRGAVYIYSTSATFTVRTTTVIQLAKHPDSQPTITMTPQNGIATCTLAQGIYKVLPVPLPDDFTMETTGTNEAVIFSVKDPPPNPNSVQQFQNIFGSPQAILSAYFPPVAGAKNFQLLADEDPGCAAAG
jgi:hypothetical protein